MNHHTEARNIMAATTVVDAHHDILMDILDRHKRGEFGALSGEWATRLQSGGVDVQVLPVFIEDKYLPALGLREVLRMIEAAHTELERDNSAIELATTATEIDVINTRGKIAGVLALEGCDSLQADPAMLRVLYRLGVRMVGLTWERRNAFADGTGEKTPGGLTEIGRQAVREMATHNVIPDVSHLAEPGFWELVELADGPVVASHSNARAIREHPRNLIDDQIRAIAASGGVIGLNFFGFYVHPESATLDRLIDHAAHIAELVGPEHIGIGADFLEGPLREMSKSAIANLPIAPDVIDHWVAECEQADDMPIVVEGFLRRGFSAADVRGIMGENWMRVFRQVWG